MSKKNYPASEGSSKLFEWSNYDDLDRKTDLDFVERNSKHLDSVLLDSLCYNDPIYCPKQAQSDYKKHHESAEDYEKLKRGDQDFANRLRQDLSGKEAFQSSTLQSSEAVGSLGSSAQWSCRGNANYPAFDWPFNGLNSNLVIMIPDVEKDPMVECWIESVNSILSKESEVFRHGLASHSGAFHSRGQAPATPAYYPSSSSSSAYQRRVTLPIPTRNEISLDTLDEFHSPIFPFRPQIFHGDCLASTPSGSPFATGNSPCMPQRCSRSGEADCPLQNVAFNRGCPAAISTFPISASGQVLPRNRNHLFSAQKIVRLPGKYGDVRSARLKYKTEMCRNFVFRGVCGKSSQCLFAHGEHELRPRYVGSNFRTKFCILFRETGVCKYGSRCNYIH